MAAQRAFNVAIVGKGLPRKIVLDIPFELTDFIDRLEQKFTLAPGELDRLELRRVDEEPNDENAEGLYNALTTTGLSRKINSTELLKAAGVQYIVGKIGAEPAGACLRRCTG